jgi:hypothetical protein
MSPENFDLMYFWRYARMAFEAIQELYEDNPYLEHRLSPLRREVANITVLLADPAFSNQLTEARRSLHAANGSLKSLLSDLALLNQSDRASLDITSAIEAELKSLQYPINSLFKILNSNG